MKEVFVKNFSINQQFLQFNLLKKKKKMFRTIEIPIQGENTLIHIVFQIKRRICKDIEKLQNLSVKSFEQFGSKFRTKIVNDRNTGTHSTNQRDIELKEKKFYSYYNGVIPTKLII